MVKLTQKEIEDLKKQRIHYLHEGLKHMPGSKKWKECKEKLDEIAKKLEPYITEKEKNLRPKALSRLKIVSGKQVGTLYHLTNIEGMDYILKNNVLESRNFGGHVSLTRDKMMNSYVGHPPAMFFKLIIDGDKLSNNYKIEPYQYKSNTGIYLPESEEMIEGTIKNISKYIKGIAFIEKNFEYYLDRFREEGKDVNSKLFQKYLFSDLIKMLKELDKKYGLYVQIGSQIKKDNKWFKDKGLL